MNVTNGNIAYHSYYYQLVTPLPLSHLKGIYGGFRYPVQDARPIIPLYDLEVLTIWWKKCTHAISMGYFLHCIEFLSKSCILVL